MSPRRQRGVTLIEVLIALVIIAIGLLGVAKMQALAVSSTRTSSVRSLVAIEAASLASAMHANRAYWSNAATATTTFTASVAGNAISATSDSALSAQSANCRTSVCVGTPMAAFDLIAWGGALQAVVPASTGAVACSGAPVTCTITVNWQESFVGMNASTQYAAGQNVVNQSYSLLVQP